MSGGRFPHLHRRNGIFHLRLRVPDVVRRKLGMCEISRSLKTYDKARARLLAAVFVPRFEEVFAVLKGMEISKADVQKMVRGLYDDLSREVDRGFLPSSSRPDLEIIEQRGLARERLAVLQEQIDFHSYDQSIRYRAAMLAGASLPESSDPPHTSMVDLANGVARAEVEQLRLALFRMEDRLTQYVPADALFRETLPVTQLVGYAAPAQMAQAGPSIKAVLDQHLQSGKAKWTAKTLAGKTRMLGYLVEHIGPDTPITAVTPDMVRSFKVAISHLRSNHRVCRAQSFAEKQTQNEQLRIQPETILNIYNPTRAFFAWATDTEGYLASNPAAKIRIEVAKKIKGVKSRRPFTAAELHTLFTAPLFTGCQSAKRRHMPGTVIMRDDYFWVPILGYYSGARLGELVQLHLRDVVLDGPVPYIEITEEVEKGSKLQPAKHVKSNAGVRKIPLHPDVLALGFAEFVARRRKWKRSPRLFDRIEFGADGQASTTFSKWFARLLDQRGLKDSALTFHSLRHGAQDAFRDAQLPQYIIDRLFGHSSGTTAEEYGNGVSIEVLDAAICAMKLKVRLPAIWQT